MVAQPAQEAGEGIRLVGGFTVTNGGKLLVLTGSPADFCGTTSEQVGDLGIIYMNS